MKKLTVKWLKSKEACSYGIARFKDCGKESPSEVMEALLAEKKLAWANWLIARLLSPKDRIRYAIFAAEQVIELFENKYHDDKRPRQAIEAAKAVLKKNNKTARAAVAAWAARAARAAWSAAGDAVWAAWAAGDAAEAAAGDAVWAAVAARAAGAARVAGAAVAARAAWSAAEAAWSAREDIFVKIIRYGMGLCFGREA